MERVGTTYRTRAIAISVIAHALLLLAASFVLFEQEVAVPEYVTIEVRPYEEPQRSAPQVERAQRFLPKRDNASKERTRPNIQLPPPPADVPVLSPDEPVAVNELALIDRAFFGDSLYAIVKANPHLRPLVLRQMLVENVPTEDSLAVLRRQLAAAMLPYLNMSDAERQARFHTKVFGTPTNTMRPGPIPGNIPISDILRALIELLK